MESPRSVRWKLINENVSAKTVGSGEQTTSRVSGIDKVLYCRNSDRIVSISHTGLILPRLVVFLYVLRSLCH